MASSVNPSGFSNPFLNAMREKGIKVPQVEFVEEVLNPSNVSNFNPKNIKKLVEKIHSLVVSSFRVDDSSTLRSVDELYARIFQIIPKDELPEEIRESIEKTQALLSKDLKFLDLLKKIESLNTDSPERVEPSTECAGARDLLKEVKELKSNPAELDKWVKSLDFRKMIEENDPRLHELVIKGTEEFDQVSFYRNMKDVIDIENPAHCQFLKELFTKEEGKYGFRLLVDCCIFKDDYVGGPNFTTYDQCMKALEFFKAIEKPELLESFIEKQRKGTLLSKNIFCFFDPEKTLNLEKLFAAGFPIDIKLFSNILNSQNYEVILILLEHIKQEFVEDHSEEILRILMEANDLKVTQYVFEHIPSLLSKCTFSMIKEAVQDNYQEFIDLVIDSIELSMDSIDELLSVAKGNYNLKIIRKLCEKRTPSNYLEVIGIGGIKEPDLFIKTLTKYALMSPLQEVYDLIKDFPQIADYLPNVLRVVSLVVRFPSLRFVRSLDFFRFEEEFSVEAYLERTITYGIGNRALVSDLSKKLNELSRDNILDATIKNRVERGLCLCDKSKVLENPYQKKRINDQDNIPAYTPLRREGGGRVLSSRYSYSWKKLADVWFGRRQWNPKTEYASAELVESSVMCDTYRYYSSNERLIQYSYYPEGSEEKYPTTLVTPSRWIHTPADTIKKLQPHLEDLQKEIVGFPLDRNDPKSMKLFFEKVARGYWLIATLCETYRGTPHNAMIWLNLIYEHHKLPPPIPKMDNFFLDNTALMFPLEKMIEDWESFFEPIFPNIREAASSQQALQ